MSSAYLSLLIFLPAISIPACASCSLTFRMMYSAYKLNKQGDNIQPWRIPFPIWTQSLFRVWFSLLLPALHAGFSGGRAGGLASRLLKNFPQFLATFLPHLPFNFSAHFLDLWFFSFTRKFLSLHILGCWFTLKTEAPGELPKTQHHPVYSQRFCWVRWPQAPLLTGMALLSRLVFTIRTPCYAWPPHLWLSLPRAVLQAELPTMAEMFLLNIPSLSNMLAVGHNQWRIPGNRIRATLGLIWTAHVVTADHAGQCRMRNCTGGSAAQQPPLCSVLANGKEGASCHTEQGRRWIQNTQNFKVTSVIPHKIWALEM